jgi:creatinine amidohydrolase
MKVDCYWIRNTETTLADLRRASQGVALIPLASIESHGPHLPLGCDPIKTDNLVRHVVARETVAVLPTLLYSYVAEARMLPGAVHIRSDVLMDYVENICDEVYRNGFSKIALMHGHGGNTALSTMFAGRMLEKEKPYAIYSFSAQAGRWDEMKKTAESRSWGHACEWETSMLMMADPALVRMDLIGKRTFPDAPGARVATALTQVDWVARHPEMAVGEPQKASREKGARWLAMAVEGVVQHLRLIKKDTRTPAVIRAYIRRVHGVASGTNRKSGTTRSVVKTRRIRPT